MGKVLGNKVALITGGGRGIGAACARLFASEGAFAVIASRTSSELNQVAKEIEDAEGKGRVLAVESDVSREEDVKRLFEKMRETFGPADLLINNAAIVIAKPFEEMEVAEWDRIMEVNLRGAFLCAREAFRQMKESGRGGVIINLSSLGGIRGTEKFPGLSAYVTSKHGIVGLTESLAVEGKPYGIRVNCVAPGAIDTKMLGEAAPFLKTKTTPLDVARIILSFCDDEQSRTVTGTVLEMHSNE